MIDYQQLTDNLSMGIVVINRAMEVLFWNLWMEEHSGIPRSQITGKVLTDEFPGLEQKGFAWKVQTVFRLGNFSFFSQKQHRFLFSFENTKYLGPSLPYMQQDVILLPLKAADGTVENICLSVLDVTTAVYYQEQLLESKSKVEELSRLDELTQINNRRHLMTRFNEELCRRRRAGGELMVILLDVDHFKQVNDIRGHLCGDYVLKQLAAIMKDQLREYDILGRYGGEEFVAVLPGSPLSGGLIVAERLRVGVEGYDFEFENSHFKITISLGLVSTERIADPNTTMLLKMADDCLYKAKESGRNRVVCAEPEDAQPEHAGSAA
ncbi:MAG: sensor domain-containing diguanylate cyclase [Pseudomonadota bacterium]